MAKKPMEVPEDIQLAIVAAYGPDVLMADLAKQFGWSGATVSKVIRRRAPGLVRDVRRIRNDRKR